MNLGNIVLGNNTAITQLAQKTAIHQGRSAVVFLVNKLILSPVLYFYTVKSRDSAGQLCLTGKQTDLTVKDPLRPPPPSQPRGAGLLVILYDVKEDKRSGGSIKCKWKRICYLTWNVYVTGVNSEEGSSLIMHAPITGSGEIITGHRHSSSGQDQGGYYHGYIIYKSDFRIKWRSLSCSCSPRPPTQPEER